jgi:hypothetical protein
MLDEPVTWFWLFVWEYAPFVVLFLVTFLGGLGMAIYRGIQEKKALRRAMRGD